LDLNAKGCGPQLIRLGFYPFGDAAPTLFEKKPSSVSTRAPWGLSGSLLTVLMARNVEIAVLIVVLLTVWCAGAAIMKSNGKYRVK
jgi:hypothetical protein